MATEAVIRPLVRRERPVNPAWDRMFFAGMTVLMWATVLFGFTKTYFGAGMVAAPLPNLLIHIHGAAFTLWMVLLVVQIGLISAKKLQWHRQLGLVGFGLSIAMVVLGVMAAIDALRRGVGALNVTPKTFLVVPLSDMVIFSVLVLFAYLARRQPAAHKRLILIATIALMDAAVGRWPVAIFAAQPKLQDLVPLAFLLLVAGYDLISLGRIHRSTAWASALLIVVHLGRFPLGMTHAWQVFAGALGGKA
jgi:hypothetical protein